MTELPEVPLPRADGLQFRPLTGADIDEWIALIERIAAAEKPPWHQLRSDLEDIFASTKNDPARNTVVGVDAAGTARAWGRVTKNAVGAKAFAYGGVDPEWQRRGVGSAVLRWQQDQTVRRFAEDSMAEPRVRGFCEEDNPAHRGLFAAAGFEVVRYFSSMVRALDGALPSVETDPGIDIVTYHPDFSEATRLAHNEAFSDHWGFEPRDQEAWGFMLGHPHNRPDWSALAVARDSGTVVGYQLSSYDPEASAGHGREEGYTELLGVRRGWRGRRVAAALLADAMRRFKDAGMDDAGLDVDTENPTGALGLYQRMGYRATRRSMAWDFLPG